MKKIAILLLSLLPVLITAQENILKQTLSISFENVELQQAFLEISQESGITISYNNKLSDMTIPVSGNFKNKTISNILTNLLRDKTLDFKQIADQIVIFEKKDAGSDKSENNSSIEGLIIDEKTKDPLPYVNVVIVGTNIGTMSDLNGRYKIEKLPAGKYNLMFLSIGYEQKEIENIVLTSDQNYDVGISYLAVAFITLNEVVVSPGSYSVMEKTKSVISLSNENVKNMAYADDITRSVSRLPGISASDYSSKFAIRGGEANEVLISLDGMELYEPFHQRDFSGGLFNIVDIDVVRGVDLMTGGYSSEYGNRLSGVFNMKSKTINNNERHTKIGLSVMNAQLYTDGKFANNKGSYIISGRRGLLDLSLKALGNNEWFPKFYDGFAKVEYKLNNKHTMSFHFLNSGDKALINNAPEGDAIEEFNSEFNSIYAWASLKSSYSDKLFSRSMLYTGNINHLRTGELAKYEPTDKGTFEISDRRDYSFIGIKQDWNWETFKKLHLKFGFEIKELRSDYQYEDSIHELRVNQNEELYFFNRNLSFSSKPQGEQFGSYVNTRFKIYPRLIAETGLRFDYTSYTGDKNWSPRASLLYILSNRTSIRGGWGYYYQSQFINNIDLLSDAGDFNSAALAKHYVLGLEHNFMNGINLRLEGYYKDYSNVSPFWTNLRDHLESYPEARNDLVKIELNGITSKGVELFLKYDEGKKISWWFSYALAQAVDDIKSIDYNGMLLKRTGKTPRLNDQRHTIYADINYKPSKTWHISTSWQYYVGWPRTDYTYRYTFLPDGEYHFYAVHSEYNSTLYPAYHRMDIKVNKSFSLKYGSINAYLLIVNVYNRENLKKFDLDSQNNNEEYSLDANGNYVKFIDNKYWLGLVPVFGLSWEF
jgi:outer membrane receptor for ferrienterochelin and colicin